MHLRRGHGSNLAKNGTRYSEGKDEKILTFTVFLVIYMRQYDRLIPKPGRVPSIGKMSKLSTFYRNGSRFLDR